MVFSSLSFLFCFFPAFLLVYYLTPSRPAGARNAVLLVGSCVFYIIGLDGQWAYFALLAASVLVNYGLGLAITRDKPRAKLWLIVGLCYNFLWLFLFKYLNFLLTGVNGVLGWVSGGKAAVPLLGWVLPVGISFYTFSAGGYLIDVYRGTVAPERSLLTFGTYLTMFPKLVSGPIASYAQLQPEFGARDVSLRQAVDGLKLFVFGMAFKILLANQLGGLWSDVTTIGFESLSTPLAWMAAFAYSFQLYFDFWGYSLMAIGIGRMLGFHLPENFRCPYLALSMTEFWRRWHITLGTWFREYLYFPLGGSRCSRGRMIFNLLVVWAATGLWHGAHLNFLLWGSGPVWNPHGRKALAQEISRPLAGPRASVHARAHPAVVGGVLRVGPRAARRVFRPAAAAVFARGGLPARFSQVRQDLRGVPRAGPAVLDVAAGVCVPPAQGHVGRGGHSGRAVLAVPVLPEQGHERSLYVLPILRSADV